MPTITGSNSSTQQKSSVPPVPPCYDFRARQRATCDAPTRPADTWGSWRLDRTSLTLHLRKLHPANSVEFSAIELDLEKLTDPAKMLNLILRLEAKVYVTPEDIVELIHALNELLHPMSKICRDGRAGTLNVRDYVNRLALAKAEKIDTRRLAA